MIAGRYQSIVIVLRDVDAPVPNAAAVHLSQLQIDARDVAASINTLRTGQGQVTAGTIDGTATITYDSVVKLINQPGIQLKEEGGKLQVTAPIQLLGQQFTVSGTANLKIEGAEVAISVADLAVDGLPADIIPGASQLIQQYAEPARGPAAAAEAAVQPPGAGGRAATRRAGRPGHREERAAQLRRRRSLSRIVVGW